MVACLSTSVGLRWALAYTADLMQACVCSWRRWLGLVKWRIRFNHSGDHACSKLFKLHVFLETDRRKQGENGFLRLLLRLSHFARSERTAGSSRCSKIGNLKIRSVYRGSRLIRFSCTRLSGAR